MQWIKTRIDFSAVQADIDTGKPANFNTCFHSEDEAPDKGRTSNEPYSYERWLPLILASRNLSSDVVQKVSFTQSQARLLHDACSASIQVKRVNLTMAEDLNDEIAAALSTLRFPPEGLFVRLDACSPKDGAHKVPGKMSLHSVEEIILRLVTSGRCRAALEDCLDSMKTVELFFLPFDPRMASEREYRVFCRTGDCSITGISQYRWHKPWRFATSPEGEQNAIIHRICQQAEHIRRQILADVKSKDENDRMLMAQGMSFDLLYDEDTRRVELVELNPFGIRSPCGSCLFQWIRDREVLYDENEKETVEFRVSY
ncbi:hypothetical protein CGLO_06339 [Colletotrichum gloeosporioides Cg-14]|uniref:Uncharacterized protein n=1 Tax=Colletotrichum gloeosporioides (strain Cg-14) TaxID=1237896 RepID=T0KPD8_COLGC|nr:hypothetical protein CGLO_06339 [Colletotrichum gloeosporioides Cg-14]